MALGDVFKNAVEFGKATVEALKEMDDNVATLICNTFIASIATDSNDNIVPRLEHVLQVTDNKSIRRAALEKIRIAAKESVDNKEIGRLEYDTVLYAVSRTEKKISLIRKGNYYDNSRCNYSRSVNESDLFENFRCNRRR